MKRIKKILITSLILTISVAPILARPFPDVQDNYVYKDAIEYMKTNNIVSGFSDGEFKPDRTITRGEFTKILIGSRYSKDEIDNCMTNHYMEWGEGERDYIFGNMYNESVGWVYYGSPTGHWPPTFSSIFQDVEWGIAEKCTPGEIFPNKNVCPNSGSYFFNSVGDYPHFNPPFHKYICIAKTKGIIDGYSDGNFRPDQEITVAEASKIVSNTYNLTNNQETSGDHKFKPFIDALSEKKALPITLTDYLKRGEMAEIIYRLMTNNQTKQSLTYNDLSQ
jgi:hypothetical protein